MTHNGFDWFLLESGSKFNFQLISFVFLFIFFNSGFACSLSNSILVSFDRFLIELSPMLSLFFTKFWPMSFRIISDQISANIFDFSYNYGPVLDRILIFNLLQNSSWSVTNPWSNLSRIRAIFYRYSRETIFKTIQIINLLLVSLLLDFV